MEEFVDVFYHGNLVGTLAKGGGGTVVFEYSDDWIQSGFSLNPFSLPLNKGVFVPPTGRACFGVFEDSLPDSWGRLVLDRFLESKGIELSSIGFIDRFSFLSDDGFGALEYKPRNAIPSRSNIDSLDEVYADCQAIINEQSPRDIDFLLANAGSSGGSRPKVFAKIDGDDWIVKFPASVDSSNIGVLEYEYMSAAKECGITIPDIRLLPSQKNKGYFAVKRFDRLGDKRIHVVTASGLLENDFSLCLFDYFDLLKLTAIMTKDENAVWQMYRLMCFNVYAKNQDDHGKNFSFLYDEDSKSWKLAPAYDLTFCMTRFKQQSTTVNRKGIDIREEDFVAVGQKVGLSKQKCLAVANEIKAIVKKRLAKYLK